MAYGFADPAAQGVVAVGGLRGMAVGAGVGELYQTVGAVVAERQTLAVRLLPLDHITRTVVTIASAVELA